MLLDVVRFIRITSRNVKEVIVMLSELLSDALKRHRARRAEEERRQAREESMSEEIVQLRQRVKELEEERNGGTPGS